MVPNQSRLRRFFRALALHGSVGIFAGTASIWAQSQYATSDADGNLISQVTSAAAIGPTIVTQPPGQLSQLGASVSFSVVASGSATLTYQWQANHVPISTVANPSAATPTLVLTNLSAGSFTIYRVVVTNGSGNATSNDASLQLDSAGDGIPDSWKISHFGANWATNPLAAAGADFDGDGISNREEYLDGTDPASAASHFYRLVVTQGQVAVTPAGNRFPLNAVVTLTAASVGGTQFVGWTGDVTSALNPLVLTMTQNYSVGAVSGIFPLDRPTLSPSFTNKYGTNVFQFAVQADGRTVMVGSFNAIAGAPRNRVARLNVDGSLDPSFTPNVDGAVQSIAIQADQRIVIAGSFTKVNEVTRFNVARLNADGSLDTSFDPGSAVPGAAATIVQLQPTTGKIVVINGFSVVLRLMPSGAIDGSFVTGSGPDGSVSGVGFQPDGRLILTGSFTSINGTPRSRIARLNDNGSVDLTFVATATAGLGPLLVRPDGKIYVVAGFNGNVNGVPTSLARLNAVDGSLDSGFNVEANTTLTVNRPGGLFLQSNGQLLVAGSVSTPSGFFSNLARYNLDGSLDLTISGILSDTNIVTCGAVDGGGKLLLGGSFTQFAAESHLNLARFRASDGLLDSTFTASASVKSSVTGIKVMPDGSSIAWGDFTVVNGVPCNYLARLNPDGSLDTLFNSGAGGGPDGPVTALAVQPNGRFLVGGNFFNYDSAPLSTAFLLRINSDGSPDPSFALPGFGLNGYVTALTVQSDGRIIVGGGFTALDTQTTNGLLRFNPLGNVDTSFVPPTTAVLQPFLTREITVQPGGGYLLCGAYSIVGGTFKTFIRVSDSGAYDATFPTVVFDATVQTLLYQPDGKLLVAGDFDQFLDHAGGTAILARGVARLFPDGTYDPTFSYSNFQYFTVSVYHMALQSDGSVIVGGAFQTAGSPAFFRLARLDTIGRIDRGFRSDAFPDDNVNSVALEASGAVIAVGRFGAVGPVGRLGYARFVPSTMIQPGIISVTPNLPAYPAGTMVSLSLSPTSSDAPIVNVTFESSVDGLNFFTLGPGVPQAGGAWSFSIASLPPGISYFRALVTTARAIQARSNAVALRSPPVVTSALSVNGAVGQLFTYTGTATNPLISFTATGLPAWVGSAVFNPATGALTISGTPPAFGVFYVTLTPTNAAGSTSSTLRIIVGRSYNKWAQDNGLDPFGPATPEGDQSGLGVQNGVRYLLGVGPYDPIASLLPRASVTNVAGGRYLTLTYTRDLTATDAATVVEIINGLAPGHIWNSGPAFTTETSRTDNADGTETVVTRDLIPITAGGDRFMRLHPTFPPPPP